MIQGRHMGIPCIVFSCSYKPTRMWGKSGVCVWCAFEHLEFFVQPYGTILSLVCASFKEMKFGEYVCEHVHQGAIDF